MKKLKLITAGAIFSLSAFWIKVSAQNVGNFQFPNPTKYQSLEEIINAGLSLLRPIFIVTFLAMLLYGAWVWLTSQGDDGKIGTAKKIITAAIIGFALAVLAPSIAAIVGGFLGIQGLSSP